MHVNSHLHRQLISQIQTKRSGIAVEAVWSTPTPTPTPGSLLRLRATPTPTPTATPHPCTQAFIGIQNIFRNSSARTRFFSRSMLLPNLCPLIAYGLLKFMLLLPYCSENAELPLQLLKISRKRWRLGRGDRFWMHHGLNASVRAFPKPPTGICY